MRLTWDSRRSRPADQGRGRAFAGGVLKVRAVEVLYPEAEGVDGLAEVKGAAAGLEVLVDDAGVEPVVFAEVDLAAGKCLVGGAGAVEIDPKQRPQVAWPCTW